MPLTKNIIYAMRMPGRKRERSAGMEREPLISVIVPVYRTAAYLPACMDSLLGQTYPRLEIVLVDDGSPDECPAMCDAYAAADRRVRTVHKENGGLVSAWMAGAAVSTGAYLAFVDSDDWVETDMFTRLAAARTPEGNRKEILCCSYLLERERGAEAVRPALPAGVYEGEELERRVRPRLLGNSPRTVILSRCMKLFSRELIRDNLHFCDPRIVMGEDVNITLPALLDCERLVLLPDADLYHYRHLEASMAHRYDPRLYENIRLLREKIREILRAKKAPDAEGQAGREYQLLLLLVLRNELRGGGREGLRRLQKLLQDPELRSLVREAPAHIESRADRLLYLGLKRPSRLRLALLRLALRLHDGKGG